jgi:3-oxoacyl-[acyl-carrier protein] reductase
MNMNLAGRRALVVGGSGGIGAEISVALAGAGAHVTIHGGHDPARLASTAGRASDAGTEIETVLLEITSSENADDLLARAGQVDILVVSFGPWLEAPIHETGPEEWDRMIGMNLAIPARLISATLPGMRERGYGRILVFGAPRGDRLAGYDKIAAYAAAKQGLASLVRSTARQYAHENITCNMICPGYVRTEYYDVEQAARIAARLPGGRMIDPADVASLALELVAPESGLVNGAIIAVDAGA